MPHDIVSSAAEAETGGGFLQRKDAIPFIAHLLLKEKWSSTVVHAPMECEQHHSGRHRQRFLPSANNGRKPWTCISSIGLKTNSARDSFRILAASFRRIEPLSAAAGRERPPLPLVHPWSFQCCFMEISLLGSTGAISFVEVDPCGYHLTRRRFFMGWKPRR
jgi:hypothetical protein